MYDVARKRPRGEINMIVSPKPFDYIQEQII